VFEDDMRKSSLEIKDFCLCHCMRLKLAIDKSLAPRFSFIAGFYSLVISELS